jgi:hypothetical protein
VHTSYFAPHLGKYLVHMYNLLWILNINRAASHFLGHLPPFLLLLCQVYSWYCSFVSGSGKAQSCRLFPASVCASFRRINRLRHVTVYIFKHITVTGVYITMFIKYLGSFPVNFNYPGTYLFVPVDSYSSRLFFTCLSSFKSR